MKYDLEANLISLEISKGKIAKTLEFGSIIVHVSPGGKPILIEILNASKFKTKLTSLKTIKQISEAI